MADKIFNDKLDNDGGYIIPEELVPAFEELMKEVEEKGYVDLREYKKSDGAKSKIVTEIVKEYLQSNNYDGLFHENAQCGCILSNLCPCGEWFGDCEPGYQIPCECEKEENGELAQSHGFHIGRKE